MKTAKLLALCLCLPLCLTACIQAEPSENSSESPSVSSSSESSQSQSAEDPDSLEIKLTPELLEQNRMNQRNAFYITEDARSYYYRHPIKGTLYRYDKETGKQKELFNKNLTYSDNGFLHSIKLYEDRIFFVTRTSEDQAPTLYSIDRNGGNLVKIISNVGDDYIPTKNFLYFTTAADPETDLWFTLYRLEWKTGEIKKLLNAECEFLNLVGDTLYYIDWTFTEESFDSGSVICKYNLTTGKREAINVQSSYPKRLSSFEGLYFLDDVLYFRASQGEINASESAVFSYDLNSGITKKIISVSDLVQNGARPGTRIYYLTVLTPDHFLIYAETNDVQQNTIQQYTLAEIKNGQKTLTQNPLNPTQRILFQPYYSNKTVILIPTVCDDDKYRIINMEELNKTIDDEQAA